MSVDHKRNADACLLPGGAELQGVLAVLGEEIIVQDEGADARDLPE